MCFGEIHRNMEKKSEYVFEEHFQLGALIGDGDHKS